MYHLGDNIISSLGFTARENFEAVKQGISGIKRYDTGVFDLPEAFMASLIDKEKLNDEFAKMSSENKYADLEKATILSVYNANSEAKIDLSSEKTIFILSTTKSINNNCSLFWGNPNTPVVVSTGCISGAVAQIAAMRELESGNYDHAVVLGIEFLSKFIISGFQSFKALSPVLCRPFDKDRCGLNLGEAAATLIMSNEQLTINNDIRLVAGAIRNDANHISAPSRTGEGGYRALRHILQNIDSDEVAFINAHGTATPYNDAAEVNAIVRAGLENVPVNSLKPFFGHTLGAAGVVESIVSMRALKEKITLKSKNFYEQDFEKSINISQEHHFYDKPYFIKMLSGFGGCNAALLYKK